MSTPTVDEFEECCGYTCQHETSEQHYIVTKKDLTTYGQSRYEEGVKAERGRCKELVAAHLRTNTYEGNDARVFKTTIEEVVGLLYDNK